MIVRASKTSARDTLRAWRTSAAVRAAWRWSGWWIRDAAVDPPDDGDQALGLEDAQRLAQRRARDAEALDQLRLVAQQLALDQLALDDEAADLVGDLLGLLPLRPLGPLGPLLPRRPRTGRWATPLMKLEATRVGSPVSGQAGRPVEQVPQHRGHLQPGQVGPEAEVRADAEGDVGVRVPLQVEAVRFGEDLGVPVGGAEPDDDLVPCPDLLVPELEVPGRGAAELVDRRDVTEQLLDRRLVVLGVLGQPGPEVRARGGRAPTR